MKKCLPLLLGSLLVISCSRESAPLTEVSVSELGESSRIWELELDLSSGSLISFDEKSVVSAEKLARRGSWSLSIDDKRYPVAAPSPTSCLLPARGEQTRGEAAPASSRFTVTVPAAGSARHFALRDEAGALLAEGNLPTPRVARAGVVSRAFRPRHRARPASPASPKPYHIYYLGHGYANQAELDADIDRFHSYLTRTYPIYAEVSSRFVVLQGQNSFDLGCGADAQVGRVYECDRSKIEKAANDGGVAYDVAIVLIKTDVYGGAAHIDEKYITVTSRNDWSLQVEAHELGHVFGLGDEYTYQAGVDYPYFVNLPTPMGGNCSMKDPNDDPMYSALWTGASYTKGCQHDYWYRSSEHSVMLDLTESFNTVSAALIRDFFAKF